MLRHFFNIAFRNLYRNKLFTSINVLGLSIAAGVFLALASYIQYHFSFDKFYEEGDRIYRIEYYEYQESQPVLRTAGRTDPRLRSPHTTPGQTGNIKDSSAPASSARIVH